jgi:hypothetical protein
LAYTNSGKSCRNPAIIAGFWQTLPESGTNLPDPGQLTGNRPSWPVFGQSSQIRPDAGGPAVLAGSLAFWPDPGWDPAAPASLAGIWRHLPDIAGFLLNLLNSGIDRSRNLTCRNLAIINCLNVKVDWVV